MTSEYDTPGQLIVNLKKRTQDPILLKGLEELEMYFSALHDWSHTIAMGKYKKPQCAIGYVQLPATDHWSRMFKPLATRLALMHEFNESIHELEKKKAYEERVALDADIADATGWEPKKCYKDTGLICFCPNCAPEMHDRKPSDFK